jgi:hypothetical protein
MSNDAVFTIHCSLHTVTMVEGSHTARRSSSTSHRVQTPLRSPSRPWAIRERDGRLGAAEAPPGTLSLDPEVLAPVPGH